MGPLHGTSDTGVVVVERGAAADAAIVVTVGADVVAASVEGLVLRAESSTLATVPARSTTTIAPSTAFALSRIT
jgi:hypothetical protein